MSEPASLLLCLLLLALAATAVPLDTLAPRLRDRRRAESAQRIREILEAEGVARRRPFWIDLQIPAVLLSEDAPAHQRLAAEAAIARLGARERARWQKAWRSHLLIAWPTGDGSLLISLPPDSP